MKKFPVAKSRSGNRVDVCSIADCALHNCLGTTSVCGQGPHFFFFFSCGVGDEAQGLSCVRQVLTTGLHPQAGFTLG